MKRRSFSPKALMARLLEFDGKCTVCGFKVGGPAGLEWDHVIPLGLGGDDEIGNLEPLCRPCHRAKTRSDVTAIAKTKRQRQRKLGVKKPRSIRAWRNFRGEIVRKEG